MEESDITKLIQAEKDIILKLNKIKSKAKKCHKKCNIGRTTGVSVGALGTVSTFCGVFLAPVTGGASVALTAGGLAASATGAFTSVGTEITSLYLNKRQRKKLEKLLENRLETYKVVGEKLSKYLGTVKKGAITAVVETKTIFDIAKILKFLEINKDIYGITDLCAGMFVVNVTGGITQSVREALNKGLAQLGIKLGAKTLLVGLGGAFILLDVVSLVKSWTTPSKMCTQIDDIISVIQKRLDQLETEFPVGMDTQEINYYRLDKSGRLSLNTTAVPISTNFYPSLLHLELE